MGIILSIFNEFFSNLNKYLAIFWECEALSEGPRKKFDIGLTCLIAL